MDFGVADKSGNNGKKGKGGVDVEAIRREVELRRLGVRSCLGYTLCTKRDYEVNWHHVVICEALDRLAYGEIKKLMIFAPPQHGKFLPADTPILTSVGWKAHGDLVVGDLVFGQDGKPKRVLANSGLYEWGCRQMFYVSDVGAYNSMWCAPEHLWRYDVDYGEGVKTYVTEASGVFGISGMLSGVSKCLPIIDRGALDFEGLDGVDAFGLDVKRIGEARFKLLHFANDSRVFVGNCIEVEGGMYLAGKDLIPTHNSELTSRRFIPFNFGLNPSLKVVLASYSQNVATALHRDIQRTMESEEHLVLFPGARLGKATDDDEFAKNATRLDVIGVKGMTGGFLKSVGTSGSLTSTTVDLGVIDDPVKGAADASSLLQRDRLWDWYLQEFKTRLHNGSRQLIVMTRWHEDDLCGRILAEEDDWVVVKLPAIAEEDEEFRKRGEALWEARHSLARLLQVEKSSPRTFVSLYQQRPTAMDGNIFRRDHFAIEPLMNIPKGALVRIDFAVDTAYTSKQQNDPSGILMFSKHDGILYLLGYTEVRKEISDLVKHISRVVSDFGGFNSKVFIEPKASGQSVYQILKTTLKMNVREVVMLEGDKVARANSIEPLLWGGKVVMLRGDWNNMFLDQLMAFPKGKHDEAVDCLIMAVNESFNKGGRRVAQRKIRLLGR